MRKKLAILYLLFFAFISQMIAQTNIENTEFGQFYDINEMLFEGFLDSNYEPETSLKVSYEIGERFTQGYFYNLENKKITGELMFSKLNTYFQFRSKKGSEIKTIKPKECLGYVIGIDSFAVIQNFDVRRDLVAIKSKKKEFAEVICKIKGIAFFKHTRAGLNNTITTYLYKMDTSENYISFSKSNNNFKKEALLVFGEIQFLKEKIESGKYEYSDLSRMIKIFEYKFKFDHNESIYYNNSWDEIKINNDISFYADIVEIKDSIFHVKYFTKQKELIYEGHFSSFYPINKNGVFIWYYPNGEIRKNIVYKNNEVLNSISTYHKNGNIRYEYTIDDKSKFFNKVGSYSGINILNNGVGGEVFYDTIMSREITREFFNNKLFFSYYNDENGKTIYQKCDKNAKLKSFNMLQSNIEENFIYPKESIKNYNHGYILVRCVVEPSGLVSELEIVKGIDESINKAVLKYLERMKSSKSWKPAKINKEKVTQEVLLPFFFSINGFSRYRNNYYWNNNMWMHHHHYHHHNNVPPPNYTPPRVPTGF